MKITKLGHCCLLIKYKNKIILTDPGEYSDAQNTVLGVDLILITHEHADHLHIESLKQVLRNNPNAKVLTNTSVGKILEKETIPFQIVEDGQDAYFTEILIEGFGNKHEEIYKELGQVQNTGYFIDNKLFYPGDAFTNPQKPVEILALPIAGPWMNFKSAMSYLLDINPKFAFPVHDGMIISNRPGPLYRLPPIITQDTTINFIPLKDGESYEFE